MSWIGTGLLKLFSSMSALFFGISSHQKLSWLDRGDRAVGIEYVSDGVGRKGGATIPIVARASRLVVLSAGAFGSPAILERSGIGGKSVLEKNGVELRVDLPGVGENYMGALYFIKPCFIAHLQCRSQLHVPSVRGDGGCGYPGSGIPRYSRGSST